MGISIYYTARRLKPLTAKESAVVESIIEMYEKDADEGWESFFVYDPDPQDPTGADVIFEGATGLPSDSEESLMAGLTHWCKALAELRMELPDADWSVLVDDHKLPWDEKEGGYDIYAE